jgi:putative oxidoreductase
MRKLFSIASNIHLNSLALLFLRLTIGVAMGFYGYHKLTHFQEMMLEDFWVKDVNFMGWGGPVSLALTVFAEFFCSIFLILGLATRLSLIPLLICTGYIAGVLDHFELVSAGEHGYSVNHAFFYFMIYLVLLLTGPGRWSVDKLISK